MDKQLLKTKKDYYAKQIEISRTEIKALDSIIMAKRATLIAYEDLMATIIEFEHNHG